MVVLLFADLIQILESAFGMSILVAAQFDPDGISDRTAPIERDRPAQLALAGRDPYFSDDVVRVVSGLGTYVRDLDANLLEQVVVVSESLAAGRCSCGGDTRTPR